MAPPTQYAILETPAEQTQQKPFNDLKISTKTVMAYPNCSFIVSEHLANMFPINEITPPTAKRAKDIINPKPGFYQVKSEWGCRGIAPPNTKRAFRNQITVLIYHNDKFCNIKIFPTGKFHMTGCNDKKSYTLAAIKLLNTIRSFHTEQNPTIVQTEQDILEGTYRPQEPLAVAATPSIHSVHSADTPSAKKIVNDDDSTVAVDAVPTPKKRGRHSTKNAVAAKTKKTEDTNVETKEIQITNLSDSGGSSGSGNGSDSGNGNDGNDQLQQPLWTAPPPSISPFSMIFEVVMVNLDFVLGFKVDQIKLNDLLLEAVEEEGLYPVYEATTNTSVNIKMSYPDPVSKRYDKYYINSIDESDTNPIIQSVFTTDCHKVKPKKMRTHTFLVFSSGKVIQSGSFYDTEMKAAYYRFCKYLYDNQSKIEIGVSNAVFDFSQLRGLNALLAAASNATGANVKKEKIAVLKQQNPTIPAGITCG